MEITTKNTLSFLAVIAGIVAGAPLAIAKDWTEVTISTEGAYAPWNFTNPDGSLAGFEPELAAALCERAKLKCTLVASAWEGMIPALEAGKFDMIIAAVGITDERKKAVDFTVPYALSPASFATTKDSELADVPGTGATVSMTAGQVGVSEIEALKKTFSGKTIGIQAATVYAPFIYDNFGKVADIREYKAGSERDIDLQSGRVDVVFDDMIYLTNALDTKNGDVKLTGPQIGGTIWGDGIAMAVRKSDHDLRDRFSDAIKSALADGTVKSLSMKWFGTDVSPR